MKAICLLHVCVKNPSVSERTIMALYDSPGVLLDNIQIPSKTVRAYVIGVPSKRVSMSR